VSERFYVSSSGSRQPSDTTSNAAVAAPVVAAAGSRSAVSVSTTKKPAKKAPAKKPAAARRSTAKSEPAQTPAAPLAGVESLPDVVPVVDLDGKKILEDIDDTVFEKDLAEDPTLKEDEREGFVLSEADEADEPEQQVMVAGATADPVKDYLKQIGKVPLLNAEQEVELAKRIEAGLFSEEKLASGSGCRRSWPTSWRGSPRTAAGRRTTCWRRTCASWSAWRSATPVAACSSSI